MTTRSISNYTIQPLGPNNILIGTWDSVQDYSTVCITCYADTDTELIIYQSIDKITVVPTTVTILAAREYINNFTVNYPYIYTTLRNMSPSAQTFCTYEVVYKKVNVASEIILGGPVEVYSAINAGSFLYTPGTSSSISIAGGVSMGIVQPLGPAPPFLNETIHPLKLTTNGSLVVSQDITTIGAVKIFDSLGSAIDLGQKTMSTSLPVVIASDNSLLGITGTVNISDINGNNIKIAPVGTTSGYTDNSLQVIDTNSVYNQTLDNIPKNALITSIYDSVGTNILTDINSGGLNVNVVNIGSIGITGTVDVNHLLFNGDGYLETIDINANTKLQTIIDQTLNNGGTFWSGTTVNDGDDSNIVNLSAASAIIYSFFGNVAPTNFDSNILLTAYYSGDGTNFYKSDINISPLDPIIDPNTNSDFCYSTPCGAGYIRLKITGLTGDCVVTAILNHS